MKKIICLLMVGLMICCSGVSLAHDVPFPEPPAEKETATISLVDGWNLIAIPVLPAEPFSVRDFMDMVNEAWEITVVAVYKNGRFERYPKEGITYNMVPGEAYFVYSKYTGSFIYPPQVYPLTTAIHISGKVPDMPVSLHLDRGWNGVSVPTATLENELSLYMFSDELGEQGIRATKIAFWNNEQGWEEYKLPFVADEPISGPIVFPGFTGRGINSNEGFFLLCEENGLYIPGLKVEPERVQYTGRVSLPLSFYIGSTPFTFDLVLEDGTTVHLKGADKTIEGRLQAAAQNKEDHENYTVEGVMTVMYGFGCTPDQPGTPVDVLLVDTITPAEPSLP